MKTKADVLSIDGKKIREMDLPDFFFHEIRKDVIARVLEAKKSRQPYSPSLIAGKQYSASGKIRHRRHVWKTHYGRGIARIPRKIMSRRGTQFNWVGAAIPGAVGGRRAHPPKVISTPLGKKINKKEAQLALKSAISATASSNAVVARYSRLEEKKINRLPFVIDSKFLNLKTKKLVESLKKILGKELIKIALKKKTSRAGKGKFRGRKYKRNAGLVLVLGNDEKLNTGLFDVANAGQLSINDLARGDAGRLTIYTEKAIKDLSKRFEGEK